ncbi:E4, partial [Human papillomavirus 133]
NFKTKLFLPLLPPAPPAPGSLHRALVPVPPGTPKPGRKATEDFRRNLRAGLGPLRQRLQFDIPEEDDKENQEPHEEPQRNEEEPPPQTPQDLLSQVLSKWGLAIDQLAENILLDLRDCKRKLGIPQY